MKKTTFTSVIGVIGLASLVSVSLVSAQDAPPAPPAPPVPPVPAAAPSLTDAEVKEISSYILGFQSASNFAGAGLTVDDIDSALVSKGFEAALKGDKPSYPEEKIQVAMESLGEAVQARAAIKAEENMAAGIAFLAENGKREGVTTTASGLQYEVLKAGTDKTYVAPADGAPDNDTKFMVHYLGTLIDGTEFDKSPEGQPFPMTLQVIPGFKEALTMMPVGSKWKIFLPSELAYGPRGAGAQIGPNSALIFELELEEIVAAPPAPAPSSATTPPIPVPSPKK
ncbi:MAG: FKBP-type peptidyl-prolyl cis-trans isomerase N-terminal domain-containing protein [Akkermansiaceae bacterium]